MLSVILFLNNKIPFATPKILCMNQLSKRYIYDLECHIEYDFRNTTSSTKLSIVNLR